MTSPANLIALAEALESDDKAMTPGPWDGGNDWISWAVGNDRVYANWCGENAPTWIDNKAIARTRNSMAQIAAALRWAAGEVERLNLLVASAIPAADHEHLRSERDSARSAHRMMSAAYDRKVEECQGLRAERDALAQELADARVSMSTADQFELRSHRQSRAAGVGLGAEEREALLAVRAEIDEFGMAADDPEPGYPNHGQGTHRRRALAVLDKLLAASEGK